VILYGECKDMEKRWSEGGMHTWTLNVYASTILQINVADGKDNAYKQLTC